jgi:deferrochelatase/peroxidase EfeB
MNAALPAEADDIQALLRSGFVKLVEAAFLLLNVRDQAAARSWLRQAPVTTIADLKEYQQTALQVAISANGLRNLGIVASIVEEFAPEFLSGMAGDEARSRRLGDLEVNAPRNWRWGGTGEPDVLLLLYAEAGKLDAWKGSIIATLGQNGFELVTELATSNMHDKEPFGFTDGVSQPQIDWYEARKPGGAADLDYGNLISKGEFLLGYANEYGQYTDRPLLPAKAAEVLPRAEDRTALGDLGRNGTYLVLRELHQDVRGFWTFAARQAGQTGARSLAESMVGRHTSGQPLIAPQCAPIRGVPSSSPQNRFTYDTDPEGIVCPLGAHVRRANPRTGDMPGGSRQGLVARFLRTLGLARTGLRSDLDASSRFHRVIRRGREFGTWVPPEAAMRPDCPDPKSGLNFICLNANISRQFEFVQNAWLASAKFNGLADESDPLTGNRLPLPVGHSTDCFSLPQRNGVARRLQRIPAFVTVHGGGYFFLPGMRALLFLMQ